MKPNFNSISQFWFGYYETRASQSKRATHFSKKEIDHNNKSIDVDFDAENLLYTILLLIIKCVAVEYGSVVHPHPCR